MYRDRNVRPVGRISAHTVLGILELADRAKAVPVAKVGSADRRTFAKGGLRYPQDFPGMHGRFKAAAARSDEEALGMIVEAHDEAVAAQIEAAEVAESMTGTVIIDEFYGEGGLAESHPELGTELGESISGGVHADRGFESRPSPTAKPIGNAAKTLVVLPSRQMGKTAAQERLARLPLVSPGKAGGRALPPCPIEARRQRLTRAINWLRAERGMGVRVVDREAEIRQYQVGNCGTHMFAEAVIDFAIEAGMPVDG